MDKYEMRKLKGKHVCLNFSSRITLCGLLESAETPSGEPILFYFNGAYEAEPDMTLAKAADFYAMEAPKRREYRHEVPKRFDTDGFYKIAPEEVAIALEIPGMEKKEKS